MSVQNNIIVLWLTIVKLHITQIVYMKYFGNATIIILCYMYII